MMKNRAAWLALIVLAAATLLMVFFVLPRISDDQKPIGDAINAAGTAVKDAVTQGGAAEKELVETPAVAEEAAKSAATQTPAATQPANTAAAPQAATPQAVDPETASAITPSFDVLRVEPDGSTVIAGQAQPGSTLEISNGSAVVAKIEVGPSGDFAAVLDAPLPPGDHQLVLKATGKDGKSMVSEETATISVPKDDAGKLLAMVTKPGKASRLINVPAAQSPAGQPVPAGQPFPTGQADASQTAAPQAQAGATTDVAAATPNAAASVPGTPAAPQPAQKQGLQVTAVEIEGSRIFVAGLAQPNSALRGDADGKAIGAATAGADGHFVIEGTLDLAIGDHKIGVESLGPSGQALLRVEVPFNRPAGEQVAAIAGPVNGSAPVLAPIDGGAFDKLRNEVVRAFAILQRLYADGREPSMEELAAARSATGIALRSLAEYRLPVDASASAKAIAESTARDAAAAFAALDQLPKDIKAVGAGLSKIADLIAKAVGPAIENGARSGDIAAVPASQTVAGTGSTTPTIAQAPLTQSSQNSVIIRRGDTLWQIARRAYGQGVRYTTIYLANQDQINNPDLIQPGQIFGVPNEALPDAEEVHRKRMKGKS